MRVIKRDMQVDEKLRTAYDNMDDYLPKSQASFNSDGCITIRNYDKSNKNKDEIIILTQTETEAIIHLFFQISDKINTHRLPF